MDKTVIENLRNVVTPWVLLYIGSNTYIYSILKRSHNINSPVTFISAFKLLFRFRSLFLQTKTANRYY